LPQKGVSDGTIYNWKSKCGSINVSEARRLKELEDENRRMKKLVADYALDIQMLRSSTQKNGNARCPAQCCQALA